MYVNNINYAHITSSQIILTFIQLLNINLSAFPKIPNNSAGEQARSCAQALQSGSSNLETGGFERLDTQHRSWGKLG